MLYYVNESDPRSNVHYLGSSENKAWKKFRPVRDLNPWPMRYRCSALPTELTSQMGAGYYVAKKGHGKFDDKFPFKLLKQLIWVYWTAVLKGGVKLLPALSSTKHKILSLQRSSVSNSCSALTLCLKDYSPETLIIISSQIKFTTPSGNNLFFVSIH